MKLLSYILFFFIAVTIFCYFLLCPELSQAGYLESIQLGFAMLAVLFTLLIPFILLAVILCPNSKVIIFAQIHSGTFLVFLLVTSIASGFPGRSSFGSQFVGTIEAFLYLILIIEIFIINIVLFFKKRKNPLITSKHRVFFATIIIIFGGWLLGVLLWSLYIPSRVIVAAEKETQGKPYCIKAANNGPIESKLGLMPFNMYARHNQSLVLYFHGLMVIEGVNGRDYMNWSYKKNKFEAINKNVRKSMNLDYSSHCTPRPHFALNLPFIKLF